MVTGAKSNWILGISALPGNPYDGHTLRDALKQVERLVGWQPKQATVDLAYRGHNYQGTTKIQIVNYRTMKSKTRAVRKWLKRRAAIEPIFGHLKSDNRMQRNRLKGSQGDKINALLCACGFNFRKLLRAFYCLELKLRSLAIFVTNLKFKILKRVEFQISYKQNLPIFQ